jgi:hypothetical protein
VYEPSEILLSVGDQVRLTNGFKEQGVAFKNNEIVRITAIDKEQMTLADGRKLRRDFLHLDQGICITSYAAECLGVNQMIGIAPLTALPGMDAKAFYVMTSRASDRAIFYTDLKEALKDAVMRDGDRTAVSDYQSETSLSCVEKDLSKTIETPDIRMQAQKPDLAIQVIRQKQRKAQQAKRHGRDISHGR